MTPTPRFSTFDVKLAGRKAVVRMLEGKGGATVNSGWFTFELSEDDLVELTRAAATIVRQREFWKKYPDGVAPKDGAS